MSLAPAASTESPKGIEELPEIQYHSTQYNEASTSVEVSRSKDRQPLFHVPSRSSSQKIQSSSAATGLSGATASGSRDSVGRNSKESKGSMMGRRRNGSASSNHSGAGTGPTTTPGTSQPNSPAGATPRRKKGGLLSLLGCCGVPDNANALDGGEEPVPSHKLEKIPQRQLTSSRRTITPSDQTTASKTLISEKEKEPQANQAESTQEATQTAKRVSGSTAQDQSTNGDRDSESKQTTLVGQSGPSITINPPVNENHENGGAAEPTSLKDDDGDVEMADADSAEPTAHLSPNFEEEHQKQIPPPPPGPLPNTNQVPVQEEAPIAVASSEPVPEQKWLLPPIQPQHKGRKCLVLDLDETLVHSSFKVSSVRQPFSARKGFVLTKICRFCTKLILRYQWRSRAIIIMFTLSRGQVSINS
jgi:carboxy-terminal domain RNA polymerase II polypeptide A small phosphatase